MENNKIIITGGSSGMGFSLAEKWIKDGNTIGLIARNETKLLEAKMRLSSINPKVEVYSVAADVSDENQISKAIVELAEKMNGIDVLFNSAGILNSNYFENFSIEDFKSTMDINFYGTLYSIKSALPYLKKSKGKIINMSSLSGLQGVFGSAPYVSSKFALTGLTRTLRMELKPQGITVQMVCPSEFDSPMLLSIANEQRPIENKTFTGMIPQYSLNEMTELIYKGLKTNKFLIIPGFMAFITQKMVDIFPGISNFTIDKTIKKIYKGPKNI